MPALRLWSALALALALSAAPALAQEEDDADPEGSSPAEYPADEDYPEPPHGEEDAESDGAADLPDPEDASPDPPETSWMSANDIIRLHAKMDANGDGKVSLKEILGHHGKANLARAKTQTEEVFKDMDTSGDGKVSPEEHKASNTWSDMEYEDEEPRKMLEQMNLLETAKFKAADADKDGFLNVTELQSLLHPHTHDGVLHVVAAEAFRERDHNKDGNVTKQEFWDLYPNAEADQMDQANMTQEEHAEFERLDRNGNGAIDLDEMKDWESGAFHVETAMKDFFEVADKNKDGHVTPDEMVAAREQLKANPAFQFFEEWKDQDEL